MARTTLALSVIACVLAVAGCASAGPTAPTSDGDVHVHPAGTPQTGAIAAARALDDAPDAVRARATCGELELGQGETLLVQLPLVETDQPVQPVHTAASCKMAASSA